MHQHSEIKSHNFRYIKSWESQDCLFVYPCVERRIVLATMQFRISNQTRNAGCFIRSQPYHFDFHATHKERITEQNVDPGWNTFFLARKVSSSFYHLSTRPIDWDEKMGMRKGREGREEKRDFRLFMAIFGLSKNA